MLLLHSQWLPQGVLQLQSAIMQAVALSWLIATVLAAGEKPARIYDALLAILEGQDHGLIHTSPYKEMPSYLQRSCDLLTFFSIMSGMLQRPMLVSQSSQKIISRLKGYCNSTCQSKVAGIETYFPEPFWQKMSTSNILQPYWAVKGI